MRKQIILIYTNPKQNSKESSEKTSVPLKKKIAFLHRKLHKISFVACNCRENMVTQLVMNKFLLLVIN